MKVGHRCVSSEDLPTHESTQPVGTLPWGPRHTFLSLTLLPACQGGCQLGFPWEGRLWEPPGHLVPQLNQQDMWALPPLYTPAFPMQPLQDPMLAPLTTSAFLWAFGSVRLTTGIPAQGFPGHSGWGQPFSRTPLLGLSPQASPLSQAPGQGLLVSRGCWTPGSSGPGEAEQQGICGLDPHTGHSVMREVKLGGLSGWVSGEWQQADEGASESW